MAGRQNLLGYYPSPQIDDLHVAGPKWSAGKPHREIPGCGVWKELDAPWINSLIFCADQQSVHADIIDLDKIPGGPLALHVAQVVEDVHGARDE